MSSSASAGGAAGAVNRRRDRRGRHRLKALRGYVPTAEELDASTQYAVDGTLLPCWSWAGRPELYSGKHKTTGMNVQVVCTLDGEVAWISDPIDGARHDVYHMDESGVLDTLDPRNWTGDKGYVGRDIP
jgi:hypothetical protein